MEIFISSTMKDMQPERDAATEVLGRIGQIISKAEYFFATPETPKELCIQKANSCDIFIGIYKDRYGYVPRTDNPKGLSVTEMEYIAAKEKGIPQLIFIQKDDSKRDKELSEFLIRVQDFTNGNFCSYFGNIDQLKYEILGSLVFQLMRANLSQPEREKLEALVRDEIRYRQFLQRSFEYLDFRGIPQLKTVIQLKLEDVYIRPSLIESIPSDDMPIVKDEESFDIEAFRAKGGQVLLPPMIGVKRRKPNALDTPIENSGELLNLIGRYNKIVILGGPASGKTSLLKHTILKILEKKSPVPFPIFIPIREYASLVDNTPTLTLSNYIQLDKGMNLPKDFFIRHLDSGSCLIMLDGLDEVIDTKARKLIASKIDEFVAQHGENNTIIVTSRIVGYRDAPLSTGFSHFTISPFSADNINRFIDKWFLTVYTLEKGKDFVKQEAEQQGNHLKRIIFSENNITLLARTPLLLTLLCLLSRQGIPIPNRKFELYDYAVKTLLQTWELNKGLNLRISMQDMIDLLKTVAIWFYLNNRVVATEYELSCILKDKIASLGLEPRVQAERFLESARERSGLLIESGLKYYGFVHNSLRDFLVALELTGCNSPVEMFEEYFGKNLHSDKHSELIPIVAAVLGMQSRNRGTEFINSILYCKVPYEELTHLNLTLAVRCLAEGCEVEGATKKIVFEMISTVLHNENLSIIQEAGSLLDSSYRFEVIDILENIADRNPAAALRIISASNTESQQLEPLIRKIYQSFKSIDIGSGTNMEFAFAFFHFVNSKSMKGDKLAIDLIKDYLNQGQELGSYLMLLLSPLVYLAKNNESIKAYLLDLLKNGRPELKLVLLSYMIDSDFQEYKELCTTDSKLSKQMQYYSDTAEMEPAERIRYVIDRLKKEQSHLSGLSLLLSVIDNLTEDNVKELVEFAIGLPMKEKDRAIDLLTNLHICLENHSSLDVKKILNGIKLENQSQKRLLSLLIPPSIINNDDKAMLRTLVLDKTENAILRRRALDTLLDKQVGNSEFLELAFGLISDQDLQSNIIHDLATHRYRLSEAASIVAEESPDKSWLLEVLVRAMHNQ